MLIRRCLENGIRGKEKVNTKQGASRVLQMEMESIWKPRPPRNRPLTLR